MKKWLFVLAIIVLFGACKSKPRPPAESSPPQAQTTQPARTTTQPAQQQPATQQPTQQQPAQQQPARQPAQQQTQTASSGTYNRHSSGVILNGAITYIVKPEDTLAGIARQHYRDGTLYPLIPMVSDNVRDIDLLYPGMSLTIPDAPVNMNDSVARPNINRYFQETAVIEDQRGREGTAAGIRNHAR